MILVPALGGTCDLGAYLAHDKYPVKFSYHNFQVKRFRAVSKAAKFISRGVIFEPKYPVPGTPDPVSLTLYHSSSLRNIGTSLIYSACPTLSP